VIIGEDELAKGKYVLRNLVDSEQKDGTPEEIIRELSAGS
jgi:histidyl-tRNA synthetase